MADQADAPAEPSAVPRVLDDPDLIVAILVSLTDPKTLSAAAAVANIWRGQSIDDRVWHNLYHRRWGGERQPLRDVRVGALVELRGLASKPELNGAVAQALEWVEDVGRWAVQPINFKAWLDQRDDPGDMRGDKRHPQSYFGGPSVKVRLANLCGEWRLRYRRRHAGFEFNRSVAGLGQKLTPYDLATDTFTNVVASQGIHGVVLRAAEPMYPIEDDLAYYEVRVSGSSVGVSNGRFYDGTGACHLGWRKTSYGYHSDDGSKWRNDKVAGPRSNGMMINGEKYAESFGGEKGSKVDVIGCGIDYQRRAIFFTKNGKFQGVAFTDIECGSQQLYPTVALHENGDKCHFNFGYTLPWVHSTSSRPDSGPFLFDLPAYATSDARRAGMVGGGELPDTP